MKKKKSIDIYIKNDGTESNVCLAEGDEFIVTWYGDATINNTKVTMEKVMGISFRKGKLQMLGKDVSVSMATNNK